MKVAYSEEELTVKYPAVFKKWLIKRSQGINSFSFDIYSKSCLCVSGTMCFWGQRKGYEMGQYLGAHGLIKETCI